MKTAARIAVVFAAGILPTTPSTSLRASSPPSNSPALETAEAEDEMITVIGQRFKTWKGYAKRKDGVWSCQTRKSTKDAEIDKISCDTLIACFRVHEPKLDAWLASNAPRDERRRVRAAIDNDIGICMTERRKVAIAELTERRMASSNR